MHRPGKDLVREKFRQLRGAYLVVGLLSCIVNLLMLTGPLFMLQVYDRVLASRSVPTLVVLLGLACGLYVMMGLLDFLRTRVLSRVAHWIDDSLGDRAFGLWMVRSLAGHSETAASSQQPGYRPIQDLATLRGFMASPTILALFDLPWFPIYLAVVYLLHVQLGLLATAGAVVVIILAVLNEILTARASGAAAEADVRESKFADQAQRGADSVVAMGMLGDTTKAWRELHHASLHSHQRAIERSEMFTASSKAFRLLLQSTILALGAYLAIYQQITAGMIVAGSIIAGRALAPLDQTIGGWRMIKRARLARSRLTQYLQRNTAAVAQGVKLPEPQGHVQLQGVVKRAPQGSADGGNRIILAGVDFQLKPGDGLGIIGPSASGKSSLAKLMVGLWLPDEGSVRLDGATFEQWEPDDIGPHIGYLPQDVVLLSGTIAQNIARFDANADHGEIVAAAKLADVHEMILEFPDGYATSVDDVVSPLTGGQKQRIALARAIFRRPALIVLDEPNSNLDVEGDMALVKAVADLRSTGSVVVVMAHRPSAIASVDQLIVLKSGRIADAGNKDDVLKRSTRTA